MQHWTLHTLRWAASIYGGREDVGNGKSDPAIYYSGSQFMPYSLHRDVAAGICVLEEAGGLVTTANPPADLETAPIQDVSLGSRLYLAIR